MIHCQYFMPRKPGMSLADFQQYYRRKHIFAAGDKPTTFIQRYIQSHRVPEFEGPENFDAVAETWYDDESVVINRPKTESYPLFRADELNFVDTARVENLATIDHVLIEPQRAKGIIKAIVLIKRRAEMRLDDFRRYWLEVHGAVAAKNPGMRGYVQCHVVDSAYELVEPRWDGAAHVWFNDVAAARQAEQAIHSMAGDLPQFVGQQRATFVNEHLLIWPK